MAPNFDLDARSFKDDIAEIKKNQEKMTEAHGEMILSQALFVQKVDTYMKRGEKENDLLFERTKDVAKKEDIKGMATWGGILKALGGVSVFMGIIYGIIRIAGLS
ncbi:hypothetical protein LCGC14_1259730 [marine sediment metagenome]|uniref:Uncharacterized protein n=1 Tax=marine sediment metagenome TaxID=412755 RepID=A0A0F9NHR8_9ZZZZ